MFKASTFFCLGYTKIISRGIGSLISDPKKLKGMVKVDVASEYMHKDAIVITQPKLRNASDYGLEAYANVLYSHRYNPVNLEDLDALREYFLSQFGVDDFKEFLERNEALLKTLESAEEYIMYFSELASRFEYDKNLFKLVSSCNLNHLVVKNFPDIFQDNEDAQDEVVSGLLGTQKVISASENYEFNYEGNKFNIDNKEFEMYRISNEIRESIEEDKWNGQLKENKSEITNIIDIHDESTENALSTINNENFEDTNELKNKIPTEILEFFMQNKIMIFSQEDSTKNPESNWVYVQLETGKDELLSRGYIERALRLCGIRNIKSFQIFNEKKRNQEIIEDIVMDKIKRKNKNIVLGQKSKPIPFFEQKKPKSSLGQSKSKIFESPSAYGFIELNSAADKKKILDPNFRIFGINMFGSLLLVEDADIKLTLVVKNADAKDQEMFTAKFNEELANSRSDIKIHGNPLYNIYEGHYGTVLLRLKTFEDALEVANVMNKKQVRGKRVFIDFRRGCGIWDSGKYRENLNYFIGSRNITTKKKDNQMN